MNKNQLRPILALLIVFVLVIPRANAQTISARSIRDSIRTTLSASGVVTGKNLALSAALSPEHTTLFQLLKASGLLEQASGKVPYTVFAPTNAALTDLPDNLLSELLLPSSKQKLVQFLAYHIVKGRLTSDQLKDGQTLTNLTGQILVIHKQGDGLTIEDGRGNVAVVIQSDVRATNGVVYSINKVLQRSLK